MRRAYEVTFRDYAEVSMIWHGGEPLTMGLGFYRAALAAHAEYPDVKIENRMQSNLTLVDDETARFFRERRIKVGGSFDGVRNDALRGRSDAILAGRQKCAVCPVYPFCTGGCNNVALNENGAANNNGDSCVVLRKVYLYICRVMRNAGTDAANPIVKKIMTDKPRRPVHLDIHADSAGR